MGLLFVGGGDIITVADREAVEFDRGQHGWRGLVGVAQVEDTLEDTGMRFGFTNRIAGGGTAGSLELDFR